MTGGNWHHAKEQEGGTDPSKQKCHKIKDNGIKVPVFQASTLSEAGKAQNRAAAPQPFTRQGSTVLGPTGVVSFLPKGHVAQLKVGRRGVGGVRG